MGLAFRLLMVRSTDISPELQTPFPQKTEAGSEPPPLGSLEAQENEEQVAQTDDFASEGVWHYPVFEI